MIDEDSISEEHRDRDNNEDVRTENSADEEVNKSDRDYVFDAGGSCSDFLILVNNFLESED